MKRTKDILFICVFLLLLVSPFLIKVLHIPVDESNSEKKVLAEAPVFSLPLSRHASGPWPIYQAFTEDLFTYKNSYDNYYKDNFKLKNNLFDLYVTVKRGMLGGNPIPDNVMEGSEGWYFLGNSYCNVMLEYTALDTFKESEVKSIQESLVGTASWLKEKHIGFYVVIAPDKQQVYGNYLPLRKADRKSKLEQMKAADSDNSYNLLDLAPALNTKKQQKLFHKTDTHWNDYGAFVGFCEVMDLLRKQYPELPRPGLNDFRIDTEVTYQKDLTEMLRMKVREDQIVFRYAIPEYAIRQQPILPPPANPKFSRGYEERYSNKKRKLKVLVFRDSFSDAWIKYFKECFGACVFVRGEVPDRELIEKEAPDIVIYERVERDIDVLLPPAS